MCRIENTTPHHTMKTKGENQLSSIRREIQSSLLPFSSYGHLSSMPTARSCISISAIANTSLADFVAATRTDLCVVEPARVNAVASGQANLLNNMLTEVIVNSANGFPAEIDGQDLSRMLPSPIADSCQCQKCQDGLSLLAYLTDLFDYAEKHLKETIPNPVLVIFKLTVGDNRVF